MAMKHPHGGEQPCIKIGMFQIRIPFIHATPTIVEALQGMCNGVLCFGGIATVMAATGVSEEAAYAATFMSTFFYIINQLAGDPVIPGWITPAVPLTLMFCQSYPAEQRVHALIALQLTIGILFIVLGATGLAKKVVALVPPAIKGGVVLGAAMSAIYGEFANGGRIWQYTATLIPAVLLTVFIMYSPIIKGLAAKGNKVAALLFKLGMIPAVLLAMVLAPLTGDAVIEFSMFPLFTIPNFSVMFQELSPFSVGFPGIGMFLSALPTTFAIYIVAFGDTLVLQGIVDDSTADRDDEFVSLNVNRANFTAGVRNILLALISPFGPLNGPLGAPMTISMHARYKGSNAKSFYTMHGGTMSGCWMPWITMLLTPIVTLCRPVAGICMSMCLIVQGFTCTAVGVGYCRGNADDLAIAGAIAAVMVAQGAAMGFGVGIVVYIFFSGIKKYKADLAYNRSVIEEQEEKGRKAAELTAKAAAK